MTRPELALLHDVLALLAAEPDRQVEALPTFRETASQLRDGVVDLFPIDHALEARGVLPPGVAGALRALDARLDAMLDAPETMFTEAAIRDSDAWRAVRTLASEALALLADPAR